VHYYSAGTTTMSSKKPFSLYPEKLVLPGNTILNDNSTNLYRLL